MGANKRILQKIHHSIPPGLRRSYRFLIVLIEAIRRYFLPVFQCVVSERETGENVRIIYIGWDMKMLHYWLDRFSEDKVKIERSSWMTPWKICRNLEKNRAKAEILMVESYGIQNRCWWNQGFLLPHWMEMEVDIEISQKKSRTKNIIRNIRKNKLDCEMRREIEDFDLFYHRMYVPFVQARHGMSADIADYKHFAGKFSSEESMLFFIIVDKEPLAAAYIEEKGEVHRLSAFGVLDGSEEIFRLGVVGALYYFVMKYFSERGEAKLLVGNSKPVVLDGVSEFKRQIGAVPYLKDLPRQQKMWFIPSGTTKPLTNILKSNPLYHLHEDALQMAVFLEEKDFSDLEQFQKYYKRLNTDQVDTVTLYCFDAPVKIKIWLEGHPPVRLVDLSREKGISFPPVA